MVETGKILIAFFSHSGNARRAAEDIAARVKGDLFEIKTVADYPSDYSSTTKVARKELLDGLRPALTETVANIAAYDTVIIGFPNWWGTVPMAVFSFLEAHDFSGKKLLPFCSHGGGGLGRSVRDIRALVPRAIVREGLALQGYDGRRAGDAIAEWLSACGVRCGDSESQ